MFVSKFVKAGVTISFSVMAFVGNVSAQTWNVGMADNDRSDNPAITANVRATLSGNTLRISGRGRMNFFPITPPPYYNRSNSITNVIVDEGVTQVSSICRYLNPTNITLPNTLISLGGALDFCRTLTSVTINSDVVEISPRLFADLVNLTSINVSVNNPNYTTENGVLFNKDKSVLLAFPRGKHGEYTVPNSVITIEAQAFSNCSGLTSIIIPNSVTTIGTNAFLNSGLTSVTVLHPIPISLRQSLYFSQNVVQNACLYVPENSIDAYRNAGTWKDFGCIRAIGNEMTPEEMAQWIIGQERRAEEQRAQQNRNTGAVFGTGLGGSRPVDNRNSGTPNIEVMLSSGNANQHFKQRSEPRVQEDGPCRRQSLTGRRSRASIPRVINQNMGALRHAYNRRLRVNPGLSGTITIQFSINEIGEVVSATQLCSTINDEELERIVLERVRSFNFERIDSPGDVTEVTWPFSFTQ